MDKGRSIRIHAAGRTWLRLRRRACHTRSDQQCDSCHVKDGISSPHGRKAGKWYSGEGSERYDYLYSGSELLEWIGRLREMDDNAAVTLVSFNNHPKGKAIENAKALIGYLGNV